MSRLLSSPAKQKRVPAFETHHAGVTARQLNQHGIGARLRNGMMPPPLPDEMAFTAVRHQIQNLSWHERVVDKSVTGPKQTMRLHREQFGISWAGTNEIDNSGAV